MIVTVVGGAAGVAAVLLKNEEQRARLGRMWRQWYAKLTKRTASENREERQLKIGLSHPYDFEDNRMVSEGALTSIQYYNKVQENEAMLTNK